MRRLGGFEFTSREGGVEPDIHPSVLMDAMVDCIHKVTIEADAFSGHDVMILTGSHDPTQFGAARRATSGGGPVHIKEGAWLCTRCIIVGPVTMTGEEWFWAGFWLTCGVGAALAVGLVISLVLTILTTFVSALWEALRK